MKQTTAVFPRSLKLAAGYFLVTGLVGLFWPLLGFGPSHPEFEAKSLAYRIGAYTRASALNIAFLLVGGSILGRRSWAPTLAYGTLAIATVYGAYQFAWGFASAEPSAVVIVGSFAVVGAWNGLWAFLVYRNRDYLAGPRQADSAA